MVHYFEFSTVLIDLGSGLGWVDGNGVANMAENRNWTIHSHNHVK